MKGNILIALIVLLHLKGVTSVAVTCPECPASDMVSRCDPDCIHPDNADVGNQDRERFLGLTDGVVGIDPAGSIFPSLPFDPYEVSTSDTCAHESCCVCVHLSDLPGFNTPGPPPEGVPNFTPSTSGPSPGFLPAGETTSRRPFTFGPPPSHPPFNPWANVPRPGFVPNNR